MMFNWFSKPDPKEQQKENVRTLHKVERNLEREKRELEREEKKLENEIKKLVKEGNKPGYTMLAKQLVQVRNQKARLYSAKGKVQSIEFHSKNMGANVKLAEAMGATADTMAGINKILKPEQIAADTQAFSKAVMKMDMTDEMINETLDDMLTESGDEEESDGIITQVLDEIGIEISGKMRQAPTEFGDPISEESRASDKIIEAQLAKLKT